jgi:CTP synthase
MSYYTVGQKAPSEGLHCLTNCDCVQALRQFQYKVGPDNFCIIHVSLVPVLGVVGEQKTKPTQHSVAVLRSLGMTPNLLACRSTDPIEASVRSKLV